MQCFKVSNFILKWYILSNHIKVLMCYQCLSSSVPLRTACHMEVGGARGPRCGVWALTVHPYIVQYMTGCFPTGELTSKLILASTITREKMFVILLYKTFFIKPTMQKHKQMNLNLIKIIIAFVNFFLKHCSIYSWMWLYVKYIWYHLSEYHLTFSWAINLLFYTLFYHECLGPRTEIGRKHCW